MLWRRSIFPQLLILRVCLWVPSNRNTNCHCGTTDMYKGRVSNYGVVYDNVQLRFDQLEQRVVVLSPVKNVFCLPEQAYVDWFEMDGYRYVHDPEDSTQYATLLCDGSNNGVRLYHNGTLYAHHSRRKGASSEERIGYSQALS